MSNFASFPLSGRNLWQSLIGSRDAESLIKAAVTGVALILTLFAATQSLLHPNQSDTSSKPAPATPVDNYVEPDLATAAKLDVIRNEVYGAVNEMRAQAQVGQAFSYQYRSDAAAAKAQLNAVTGREDKTDENIGMLQAHLPLAEASGWKFIEKFRISPAHVQTLLAPQFLHMAVGVAYGHGNVWLVIQFES
ncbi:MAG: CAP domain-containing protein [Corynebacterium sp.]|nr:CAP domain-containing protein [Corynebacterium sp.]